MLTDIAGLEDHLGDMDFKVAGSRDGVTALQMDIKVKGIELPIMAQALEQAEDARLEIIDLLLDTIAEPREEMSPYAPRMHRVDVPQEKIGAIIGPGGKTIRQIEGDSGAGIDINDDGAVYVTAVDQASAEKAISAIRALTKEVERGEKYTGKVTRILPFGAFVEILPGKDALVHISELADYHVPSVEDVVQIGDEFEVLVTEIDNLGRINASRRALLSGEDLPPGGGGGGGRGRRDGGDDRGPRGRGRGDRGDRGDRGGRRGDRGDRGERRGRGDREDRPREERYRDRHADSDRDEGDDGGRGRSRGAPRYGARDRDRDRDRDSAGEREAAPVARTPRGEDDESRPEGEGRRRRRRRRRRTDDADAPAAESAPVERQPDSTDGGGRRRLRLGFSRDRRFGGGSDEPPGPPPPPRPDFGAPANH